MLVFLRGRLRRRGLVSAGAAAGRSCALVRAARSAGPRRARRLIGAAGRRGA